MELYNHNSKKYMAFEQFITHTELINTYQINTNYLINVVFPHRQVTYFLHQLPLAALSNNCYLHQQVPQNAIDKY